MLLYSERPLLQCRPRANQLRFLLNRIAQPKNRHHVALRRPLSRVPLGMSELLPLGMSELLPLGILELPPRAPS